MSLTCHASVVKNSVISVSEYSGNHDTPAFTRVGIDGFDLYLPGGTGKAVACAICEATGATYTFQDYRDG